jgi:hypothetical protein
MEAIPAVYSLALPRYVILVSGKRLLTPWILEVPMAHYNLGRNNLCGASTTKSFTGKNVEEPDAARDTRIYNIPP